MCDSVAAGVLIQTVVMTRAQARAGAGAILFADAGGLRRGCSGMNPEHIKVLVAKHMQQAAECLDDERYVLSAGCGARTAVNRAY
jgi:hypothetical protein